MKKIAFIHVGGAYAPELKAYSNYLTNNGFYVDIFKTYDKNALKDFDVEWHIMGVDYHKKNNNRIKIHEYSSLSIPPFAKCKDWAKKQINTKPDLRIFGSPFIQTNLGFNDQLPFLFRKEAAVASIFFNVKNNVPKDFDFVYSGSTHKSRKILFLLKKFTELLPENNLLIIGVPPVNLPNNLAKNPLIKFTGKIPYEQVPQRLIRAHYAINFMPDIYPFNQQRALKLMEYCAVGLPVLTSSYLWVNNFEKKMNGSFFKLKHDLSNLQLPLIKSHNFKIPDVSNLTWGNVLQKSGIVNWLNNNLY
jgi:hypothetical protein